MSSNVYVRPTLGSAAGSLLTTLNTYVVCTITAPSTSVGEDYFPVRGYSKVTVVLKAVTNNLHFKVETSLDASNWNTKILDQFVVVGTPIVLSLEEAWDWMKISVKPAVAATHGTGSFVMHGSSI